MRRNGRYVEERHGYPWDAGVPPGGTHLSACTVKEKFLSDRALGRMLEMRTGVYALFRGLKTCCLWPRQP